MTIDMPKSSLNIQIGRMHEDKPFNRVPVPLIRETLETVTVINLGSYLIIKFLLWVIMTP